MKKKLLEEMKNKTAKTDTYYWIKDKDSISEPFPLYVNNDFEWRLEIANNIKFISSGKLRLIFGKYCILREVDFIKDKIDKLPDNCYNVKLQPFVIQSSGKKNQVLFKNKLILNIGAAFVPSSEIKDGFYINFAED